MKREQDVFGWLDVVRTYPGMYFEGKSLSELEAMVFGYYVGLCNHRQVEPVPEMYGHFRWWLHYRTGWPCARGWAIAINLHHPHPDEAFAAFFAFVDEYRRLRPTTLCTVRLGARHNPTGKRMRGFGPNGLIEKPRRVEIVRYRPEPLHFLRFHYRDGIEDSHLLTTPDQKYATSIRHAKQWVRDEFQVEFAAWEPVPKGRRTARLQQTE